MVKKSTKNTKKNTKKKSTKSTKNTKNTKNTEPKNTSENTEIKNTKEKSSENTEIKNTKEKSSENTEIKNTNLVKTVAGVGLGAAIVAHVLNKTKSKNDLQRLAVSLFFNNKEIYFAGSPEIMIIHNVIYNIVPTNTISIIKSALAKHIPIQGVKSPINAISLIRALTVILDHPITNELLVLKTLDDVSECFPEQEFSIFPFLYSPPNSPDIGIMYQMENFFSWQRFCKQKNTSFIIPNETKATLKRLGLPTTNFCNNEILKNSLTDSFKKVYNCLGSNNRIENCPILQELEPRKKDLMIYLQASMNNLTLFNFLQENGIIKYSKTIQDSFSTTPWENYFAMFCRQILLCHPIHKPNDVEFLFKEFKGKIKTIFPTARLFGIQDIDMENVATFFNKIKNSPNITSFLENRCDNLSIFINNLSSKTPVDNIFNFKLIGTNIYLSEIIYNVITAKNTTQVLYENNFENESETKSETTPIVINEPESESEEHTSESVTPSPEEYTSETVTPSPEEYTSESPSPESETGNGSETSDTHSSFTSSDDYYDAMEK
jgi:hypothetical protein